MKKLWLFPMIFFILILLAGSMRWGEGPLQDFGEYRILHTKDYWTGQRWIVLFGGLAESPGDQETKPYPLYSGEWIPYLPQDELDLQMEAVLNRATYQTKWQALEAKIKELEAENKRKKLTTGGPQAGELATDPTRQALLDATWELNHLHTEARKVLLGELKAEAKQKELLATIGWGFLLVLTFAFTLHYFRVEVKRWKRVNETYEIVEYVTKNNHYPGEK